MNLFYLRYFVKLAEVRHYTKAAQQLCITQPSLSHAISQLEEELGVSLFEKNGRNTALTSFGEEFLACARQTLSTLDEGILSLQKSANGNGLIRLGFLRTLGVEFIPRLASLFLAAYPDKEIHFTFHTGVTKQLVDGLAAKQFDLAFCSQPSDLKNFTAIPVGRQDLVLIVPANHPLAERNRADLRETLPYPYIFFSPCSGMRAVTDKLFEEIGARPQIAYETEEDQVIAGLVAHGFGIALVPYMDLLLKLNVKILPLQFPSWERFFYMVNDRKTYMAPAVRLFYQFVLEKGGSL